MTQSKAWSKNGGELGPELPPPGPVYIVTEIGYGPSGLYDEDPLYEEKRGVVAFLSRLVRRKLNW